MMLLLFSFWQQKEKGNKKERLPSALFELLRHFSTLNKKNSLRSNSFLFLTLRKAPTLHAQKVRPDIPDATSLRSLRWEGIIKKTNQPKTSEATLIPIHLIRLRHLVEEREEKWRFFREERKAV
ncbi:MAG: hypothetical protein IJA03_10350 [Bacteroidaceae bacterium]|nr:hypothetical protein [Bacteroidaceae bacterium]